MPASQNEPIAIIGSSCRFPGESTSPSKLWDLLLQPREIVSPLNSGRANLSRYYNSNGEHHGSTDVEYAYLLSEDIYRFDAAFFNLSNKEAEAMDPQQRILLETVFEAFESAGNTLEAVRGSSTSVYVGLMSADWQETLLRDIDSAPMYTATGAARSILSNRVSYFFDLHGPSMTIDTACSSSLVAVHLAVQSLRQGESTTAIAAGANLILEGSPFVTESKFHMLSADGRSRMWDANAGGYARGEGFAAVVLKTLSQALADGDHIHSVIRETGVNSDGRTRGITLPSPQAQATLIRQTYARAGLDPVRDRCQYFEAHGTGTQAGDPLEAQAIREAFFEQDAQPSPEERLLVGSVKTVIGHLEGAAGLAGLIKASLAIKHQTIPPNMHFNSLNPKIEPFYHCLQVPTQPQAWPQTADGVRRASVNSFGFGGTNAHAILESFDNANVTKQTKCIASSQNATTSASELAGPLLLSAHSNTALAAKSQQYADYIEANPGVSLVEILASTGLNRTSFPVRTSFAATSRSDLITNIRKSLDGADPKAFGTRNTSNAPSKVLGVFTGQGAQWPSMGRKLLQHSHVFSLAIENCERTLAALPDGPCWSLSAELSAPEGTSRLNEACISQPLCTAVQIGLVDLLAAANITFQSVVGHSSGEIAATYAAGIIGAEDAIKIAYYRGVHTHLAHGNEGCSGSMVAVGMSYKKALEFCARPRFQGRLAPAASNSQSSVTISGDIDAIMEAKAIFDKTKTFARVLKVDKAYHSHHMLPCSDAYLRSLEACNISVSPPRSDCLWVSSVLGDQVLPEDQWQSLSGQYWVDNMVKPVLFSNALSQLALYGERCDIAIEVGPHPALQGPALQTLGALLAQAPTYVGVLRRGADDVKAFSTGLGQLWVMGGSKCFDLRGYLQAFDSSTQHGHAPQNLPTYPWDHDQVHHKESRMSRNVRARDGRPHELLGRRAPDDSDTHLRWRNFINYKELPYLKGHVFQGQTIFPAAGYVSMALEAAKTLAKGHSIGLIELLDFNIGRAMVMQDENTSLEVVFSARKAETKSPNVIVAHFDCQFCPDAASGSLEMLCNGTLEVHIDNGTIGVLPPKASGRDDLNPINIARFYDSLVDIGLNYQDHFRAMKEIHRTLDYASCTASWDASTLASGYTFHPALLDVAFQSVFAAFTAPRNGRMWAPYLPVSIKRITVNPHLSHLYSEKEVTLHMDAFITKAASTNLEGDIEIYGAGDDHIQIQVEGLVVQAIADARPSDDRLLFSQTTWDFDISTGIDLDHAEMTKNSEASGKKYQDLAVARIFQQITHRHPHLNILELNVHDGTVTRNVFDAIGKGYRTWTCTCSSSDNFDALGQQFRDHASKMTFKTLDTKQPIESQDFKQASYDVVLCSEVCIDKTTTDASIAAARHLLRDGGFLIVASHTQASTVNALHSRGLVKIDTVSNIVTATSDSISIVVAQATSNAFEVLRQPTIEHWSSENEQLVIVGGQTTPTAQIIESLQEMLRPCPEQVVVATSIDTIDLEGVSDSCSIMYLEELDELIFEKPLTELRLRNLQQLLRKAKSVLWVTETNRSHNPSAAMSLGVTRVLGEEVPSMDVQLVEVQSKETIDPSHLLTLLLQLCAAGGSRVIDADFLWTLEPELRVSPRGTEIPRVKQDMELNNRYNAGRRNIKKAIDSTQVIEITNETKPMLVEGPAKSEMIAQHDQVILDVQLAVKLPAMGSASMYLCYGWNSMISTFMLALSEKNCSTIIVSSDMAYSISAEEVISASQLTGIASLLVAQLMIDTTAPGETLVLHEPPLAITDAVSGVAAQCNIRTFLTFSDVSNPHSKAHYVHAKSSRRNIYAQLPRGETRLFDFTTGHPMLHECVSTSSKLDLALLKALGSNAIKRAFDKSCSNLVKTQAEVVSVASLTESKPISFPMVIDWSQRQNIEVLCQPIKPSNLFRSDKTYFLVGLTGGLGLSICRWMVKNGARYLAIGSRRASVPQSWLDEMKLLGAHMHIFTIDIVNRESVRSAHAEIVATMPEIAGVCNAAMAINDGLFFDLDIDDMRGTMEPKIEGSKNISELFENQPLDFFIFFSSIGCITGNAGQCNYHLGNLFMTGLAAHRRAQGLAGSAIHIGFVTDTGYVARQGQSLENHLRKKMLMPLSEVDVHQMFAEAIIAGRPGSSHAPEIITGLSEFVDVANAPVVPVWYENPRFSHLLIDENTLGQSTAMLKGGVSLKTMLAEASDVESAAKVVQEAFLAQLAVALQTDVTTIDPETAPLEMGIDSISAMEARTWFLKEVTVDVPVLQILGGESIKAICLEAATKYIGLRKPNESVAPEEVSSVPRSIPDIDTKPSPRKSRKLLKAIAPSRPFLEHMASYSSRASSVSVLDRDRISRAGSPGIHMYRTPDTDLSEAES